MIGDHEIIRRQAWKSTMNNIDSALSSLIGAFKYALFGR